MLQLTTTMTRERELHQRFLFPVQIPNRLPMIYPYPVMPMTTPSGMVWTLQLTPIKQIHCSPPLMHGGSGSSRKACSISLTGWYEC